MKVLKNQTEFKKINYQIPSLISGRIKGKLDIFFTFFIEDVLRSHGYTYRCLHEFPLLTKHGSCD